MGISWDSNGILYIYNGIYWNCSMSIPGHQILLGEGKLVIGIEVKSPICPIKNSSDLPNRVEQP
jgi:hypothetical protein